MQEKVQEFYSSRAWAKCREAYKKSVGGLCEVCLQDGLITAGEIVHHKKPVTIKNVNEPAVTLSWDNLCLLCRKHHGEAHAKHKRRYVIDELGRVQVIGD